VVAGAARGMEFYVAGQVESLPYLIVPTGTANRTHFKLRLHRCLQSMSL
jgi:hypothetical protein